MITRLDETSVLEEIIDLDPELNGDAEYLRVLIPQVTLWHRVRQSASSPIVVTVAVLTILLVLAANLPS
jgi:hypothetical protein